MATQSNRTPEQIRAGIEAERAQLAHALHNLRSEVTVASDWRRQLQQHQKQILVAAAVAGFVLGGGIAGVTGIFRRKK